MADEFDEGSLHEGMVPYRERVTDLRPDYSEFEIPERMVSLQEISDGTLGFDLTDVFSAYGWDPDTHWVDVTVDNESLALMLIRVNKADEPDMDPSRASQRQTINHSARGGEQFTLKIPDRNLTPFGIEPNSYSGESDPFLFELFMDPDTPDMVMLDPVGRVSELVWPNSEFSFPMVEGVVDEVATEMQVDVDELTEWVNRIASEFVTPTLLKLGVSVVEEPTFLSANGQRVAIATTSEVDGLPGLFFALDSLYGIPDKMLDAIWQVHQLTADRLLTELYDGEIPEDHPVMERGTDAAVIPVTKGRSDGESGIMSKTHPPIAGQAITAVTAGKTTPGELHDWLTDFATEVTNEMVKDSGLRTDREPVNIPYTPPSELPVSYSAVRIHFVEEGALSELAEQAGLPEPELAAQRAHDEQAERILMSISGLPRDYRTFRRDSHAIVVPIPDGADGHPLENDNGGNNGTNSGTDTDDTTQQTLSGSS
ncbi:hypothetical protein ACFQDD_00440 [Halorubrum pallidum]|uniref:Uncharacterized protein n=1 Tax=Halorubrum pallidum TaxID=1526114 RepID=A0ABD5SYI2_9EURY